MCPATEIPERLSRVHERIASAARTAGRNPDGVRLIAVSKGQPLSAVVRAFDAGQRDFGENYLEEAELKISSAPSEIVWHMIGHVQSRKAKTVAPHFAWVHSVDSLALAGRLSRFAVEGGFTMKIFLECNVSGEATKFGWPAADSSTWIGLIAGWRTVLDLPGLVVAGLMTMAPYSSDPEQSRPVFQRLRELRDLACRNLNCQNEWGLSMGMSDDFEQAVEEGATWLRVGRAIFGVRQ
jgi:pyridoxal phosphate enzyme (YggS family)